MPGPKLYYFDMYAAAEAIRMTLWHAKVEFEDIRLSWEEQQKLKAEGKFPAGQVPCMETPDGRMWNQSNAILHFLGAKHGLYGSDTDLETRYWADWAIETHNDLWGNGYYQAFFADDMNEELHKKTVEKAATFIHALQKRLSHNGDKHYFGGDHMTIGDIKVFSTLHSIAFNDGAKHPKIAEEIREHVHAHGHLKHWHERMEAHFHDYLKHRPHPRPL